MQQSCLTVCGPNTYTNFQSFSINGAIQELREQVPDIHELFMQLGDVHRNLDMNDTTTPVEEMKAVSSLCTLLNARSSRVKGIQLLLSMMLIAQSTTKQIIHVYTCQGVYNIYCSSLYIFPICAQPAGVMFAYTTCNNDLQPWNAVLCL